MSASCTPMVDLVHDAGCEGDRADVGAGHQAEVIDRLEQR
jgi:hypothetical protein